MKSRETAQYKHVPSCRYAVEDGPDGTYRNYLQTRLECSIHPGW